MNILILNHHTSIGKYGSESRHYTIGKHLSKQGHKIILVGSSFSHKNNEYVHNEKIKTDKINDNFYYISIKSGPSYKNNIMRLINYIDFTIKSKFIEPYFKPDVVVGSSVHPFVWITAYQLSKKFKCEFHIEIRDIWPLSLYEELPAHIGRVVTGISKLYENYFYKKAKSIIVTAPLANKYLEDEYGIKKSMINYVPHGIDLITFDNFRSHHIPPKEVVNSLKNKVSITYTGALSSSEGLENLINLAEKFITDEDIHFHIFGDGNQREKLINLSETKKLDNISFHGRFDSKYVPWILTNSDILWCGLKDRKVFKYSISKNKFYDYLASAKPIIFHSNVLESPVAQSGAAYIVKLNKLPVDELCELISNEKYRESLGQKGRSFVEREHDISIISNNYIKNFCNE